MHKPLRYGSVCSGIEAASVAWHCLGWKPAWFSEIEKFPSAVLAHHWPEVINLGDMTKIAAAIRAGNIEAPDVLVGGTPCQAFSVAGLREGLSDDRGQLTLSYVELANAIDAKRRERGEPESIIVWENVPGVFSSKDNAFGCFLAGLAGESGALESPGKRWSNAGYVLGPERAIAWRVLDAQFFGVAQRRRRVFVVATAREDIDPAKILFESEGVRRDTPPSRSSREEVAGTFKARANSGGWSQDVEMAAGGYMQVVKVGSHWDHPHNPRPTLNQSHNTGGIGASNQELFSQRGSGIIAMAHGQAGAEIKTDNSAPTLTCNHEAPIVFSSNGHASFAPGVSALRAKSGADHETLAFAENHRGEIRLQDGDGQITGPLSAGGGKPGQGYPAVMRGMAVRRLTPVECERLQGFPDNHTLIPTEKRKQITAEEYAYLCAHFPELTEEEARRMAADGPRYKAIGNSMAVPVMRWIGSRIQGALNA